MKRKEETVVEKSLEEVEQTIEEEVKEEQKIEGTEVKVTANKLVDDEGFAISESKIEDESEKTQLFVEVDGQRQAYLKSAKKIRYSSYGIMLPLLVGCIVAVFFVNEDTLAGKDYLKWVIIGLIAFVLVGLIVFKVLTKRYLDGKVKEYVASYYKTTMNYIIDGEGYSDVNVNPKGKVDNDFFVKGRFYKDIKNVGSRNVCTFKHNEREYTFVDLAASVQGVKKLEPIFVGKVLKYKTEKEVNGRILVQIIGGNKLTKPVNDIEGLELISHSNTYQIYSDMHKEKNLMTKVITDLFSKYKLGNDLLDVIISINGNEIIIGLDYNDHVMQLPVEKKFDKKLIDDIQQALFISVSIIEAIADKLEK